MANFVLLKHLYLANINKQHITETNPAQHTSTAHIHLHLQQLVYYCYLLCRFFSLFHKLHQQHNASITDNHLKKYSGAARSTVKRELTHTEFNPHWQLHVYIRTHFNSSLTRPKFHLDNTHMHQVHLGNSMTKRPLTITY